MKINAVRGGSLVSTATGEALSPAEFAFVAVPLRLKVKEGWFMGFQEAFEALAKDRELRGEPRAVLDYMLAHLSFENHIAVQQVKIAEELQMHPKAVSRAISKLVRKEVLLQGPKLGRVWSYRLNNRYGWKGRVKNLISARRASLKVVQGGKDVRRDGKS